MKNHLELKQEEESKKLTNQELQRRIDNFIRTKNQSFYEDKYPKIKDLFEKLQDYFII